jgi:collagenase-like PrtC family protease
MYSLPSDNELKKAYEMANDAGKEFIYVTPRMAEESMKKVKNHLQLLNSLGGERVVVNDLGTLQYMSELSNACVLKPHLGRQLVYLPSRCPWDEITERPVGFFTKRKVEKIFYQTALNYKPTIKFFKELDVVCADVDWIPKIFPNLRFITSNGLQVSVHLHSVPVAITRKCHMARFLGEADLNQCSRPCYTKAYFMNNPLLDKKLYLHGNTVNRLVVPNNKTMESLKKSGATELILTMSPLSQIISKSKIDDVIHRIQA